MYVCFFLILCGGCHFSVNESNTKAKDQSIKTPIEEPKQYSLSSGIHIDIVTGKFDPAKHPAFSQVSIEYADREGLFLQRDTYESFKKMHLAAEEDGINLIIRSATRNFEYQKGIWERKWTGKTKIESKVNAAITYPDYNRRAQKILEYSSMPGTSRHHWGTDIDLNSFENDYFETGEGLAIYQWLISHASAYGFCQVYTAKGDDRPDGYNEEKWHWSYLPLANQLIEIAKHSLDDSLINGFQGAEVATELSVVQKYVFGINPACKIK